MIDKLSLYNNYLGVAGAPPVSPNRFYDSGDPARDGRVPDGYVAPVVFLSGGGSWKDDSTPKHSGSVEALKASVLMLTAGGDYRIVRETAIVSGTTRVATFDGGSAPPAVGILLTFLRAAATAASGNPLAGLNLVVTTSGWKPTLRSADPAIGQLSADRVVTIALDDTGLGRPIFVPFITNGYDTPGIVVASPGAWDSQDLSMGDCTVTVALGTNFVDLVGFTAELVTARHSALGDIMRSICGSSSSCNV